MANWNYGEQGEGKAVVGDTVSLQKEKNHNLEVVECKETQVPMLNIDADELAPGDLKFIKKLGLTISNPETEEPVALGVEVKRKSLGRRLSEWLEDESDDDDSSFFSSSPSSSGSLFGGSSSLGGFSGGFGGFGGGSFGGGGAARGF